VRQTIRRGLVLAALAGTALVATAPAAFAQTTSPEAYALEGTGLLAVAPTPEATLSDPNPASVASLGIPGVLVATALTASVTSNTATASVAGLSNGTTLPIFSTLTAGAITSSCLANPDGTFVETTSIASLTINGTSLGTTTPPANDTFLNLPGVATVILNQQLIGPITGSETVNAIHISLLGLLVGETVNVASSTCGPFTSDTPIAGGKGLAVGLGLLGSVGVGYGAVYTRRRRSAEL
jgi:hypothetical protein